VAAKSIAVEASAPDVVATIASRVQKAGGSLEQTTIQNGIRVKLRTPAALTGLNVFPSKGGGCKVVFDRPDTPEADKIAALLQGTPSSSATPRATAPFGPLVDAPCWIGSDESGKGDFFGPLVVAAVAVTQESWPVLETLGVRDSKTLSDARASDLAGDIRGAFPHEVIAVLPRRYNELWREFGNLNRLLAWGHARAIENVAGRAPEAAAAVADQFGDEALVRNALFSRGRALALVQAPRAESDPAVAAASILARAEFLRRLEQLGRGVGVRLPKGASPAVEAVARALVAERGPTILDEIAKTHFKTAARVLRQT